MKRGGKEEEEMYNEEKNKDAITNDKMCIPRHHALNRNFYCKSLVKRRNHKMQHAHKYQSIILSQNT